MRKITTATLSGSILSTLIWDFTDGVSVGWLKDERVNRIGFVLTRAMTEEPRHGSHDESCRFAEHDCQDHMVSRNKLAQILNGEKIRSLLLLDITLRPYELGLCFSDRVIFEIKISREIKTPRNSLLSSFCPEFCDFDDIHFFSTDSS